MFSSFGLNAKNPVMHSLTQHLRILITNSIAIRVNEKCKIALLQFTARKSGRTSMQIFKGKTHINRDSHVTLFICYYVLFYCGFIYLFSLSVLLTVSTLVTFWIVENVPSRFVSDTYIVSESGQRLE